MPKAKQAIKYDQTIHFSVGAVIKKDDKYLLINRVQPPFGFAGVAGHIDEDEDQLQALLREVQEESGLQIKEHKLVIEEFVPWNECSKGVVGHYWYVYDCVVEGVIKQNFQETKSIGWYSVEEIKNLTLEPVWDVWFKKLKLI